MSFSGVATELPKKSAGLHLRQRIAVLIGESVSSSSVRYFSATATHIREINMAKATDTFLENEALTLSVMAAISRGTPTYDGGASDTEKKDIRRDLKCLLRSIGERYETVVSEEDHIGHIVSVSDKISNLHKSRLYKSCATGKRRLRIGRAQKALNLYLKYLWTFGWIPPPPHCPFDSIVLGRLRLPEKYQIPFTQMDDIEVYRGWVEAAKNAAKTEKISLPLWEVRVWNEG